ncbi:MAG: FtsQ-type POTRA domain-containing protein, partial [Proteobacteria bacterium]|nr:FtsQ-type POTRA domain-containing protein [Pseudomonadota bacterium]
AARVRDLFDQAKRNAPCIVFVDEIDAVGRHRGAGLGGGHDEREQTLNQILVEMDGFDSGTNIIVLAATNRPDILDPALLRPGRFDRRVTLDLPDINGRKAILEVHIKGKPLDPAIGIDVIAKQTPGFTGADIANLVNEAALLAARFNKKQIGLHEFEEAIDRVIAGPERKSRIISQREKEMTAYHEAGHALVAWNLPHADKVHKISIVSRGSIGGYTRLLPSEDRFLWTKNQFEDMLATTMGGRVAEELTFTEITTGASNDIFTATKVALEMVKRYGMSERLGPRTFGHREELIFLGREISEQRDYSDHVAEEIDQEVKTIVERAYKRATEILDAKKDKLAQVAAGSGFEVKRVEVRGVNRMNQQTIYEHVLGQRDQAMSRLDLATLREGLLQLPWVKDARVSRQLPDTLVVDVVERSPHAVMRDGDRLMLIDETGHELEPVSRDKARGMFVLSGQGAEQRVEDLGKLLEAAPALKPQVAEAEWIGNRRWNLTFKTGQVLALPEGEDQSAAALVTFARMDGVDRLLGGRVAAFDMRAHDRIYLRVPGHADELVAQQKAAAQAKTEAKKQQVAATSAAIVPKPVATARD